MSNTTTEEDVINPLDLPDDELEAAFAASEVAKDKVEEEEEAIPTEEEDSTTVEDDLPDSVDEEEEDPVVTTESDDATDATKDNTVESTKVDEDAVAEESELKAEDSEVKQINYEDEYKRLLAPFKANGREVKVNSVDDAIVLMQMGANYNKKMTGLKPNLKLMKMLENNELLDADKLNHLIDLSKKDPAAIAQLIKESGINPLDIDIEKQEYHPKSYNVNDSDVELDGILDDIRDTSSFAATIDIIGNKWDDSSKKVLMTEPEIIRVINDHVASGIYDQIKNEVDNKRMIGQLKGQSDLEAYQTVGEEINARGGFTVQKATTPVISETPKVLIPSKKSEDSKQLTNRKKAASSTKSTTKTVVEDSFDPLNMSDEEFEKLSSSKFI
jgi:hypothetical protein